MNINFKQILSSIILVVVAVTLFIILAPIVIFLVIFIAIFLAIFSFVIRSRVMKSNPDFFKQFKKPKGRIIDQEDDNYSSRDYTDQIK